MPRPRVHDVDSMLDAAEHLVGGGGPAALTLRSLAHATGAPVGTLTHAFGSRDGLVARLWLRAGSAFLERQAAGVEAVLTADGPGTDGANRRGVAATVRAALEPLALVAERPDTAAVLLGYRREDLLGPDVPAALVAELRALDQRFVALLVRLAQALWGRGDGAAVETVSVCVVDLPTGLLRRHLRGAAGVPPETATHLRAAVRGVLALGAPPTRKGTTRAHSRP
jgi:AcrR family transcriptional regulator